LSLSSHTLAQLAGLVGAVFVVLLSMFMLRRHKIAAL
jgi:hypothetical protein